MSVSLSVDGMAKTIANLSPKPVEVEHLTNPRVEEASHYYNVVHTGLPSLGLEPHLLSDTLIQSLFGIAEQFASRVDLAAMRPTVQWRSTSSTLRS
jgi:UDP-sulfoquinovose synthase